MVKVALLSLSPVPQSALLNDTLDLQIPVEPNTSYFLRLVNVAAFAGQYIWVEGHSLTIIELDGIYHKPKEVEMVYLTPGQRVGAILTTKGDRSRNYAITTAMDTELFDLMPEDLKANATAYLVYDSERELDGSPTVDSFEPMDDFDLIPADEAAVLNNPSQTIVLNVSMDNLGDGIVSGRSHSTHPSNGSNGDRPREADSYFRTTPSSTISPIEHQKYQHCILSSVLPMILLPALASTALTQTPSSWSQAGLLRSFSITMTMARLD